MFSFISVDFYLGRALVRSLFSPVRSPASGRLPFAGHFERPCDWLIQDKDAPPTFVIGTNHGM